MCGDGTQLASLITEPGHQLQISISPDGEEFAYTSKVGGARDIWRRPFGRGDAVNLTDHPAEDSQPAWSPEGDRLAFFSDRDGDKLELYLLNLTHGGLTRLTHNSYYESGASWSPNGRKLVFTRYFPAPEGQQHDGKGEVIELDLDSGAETELTELGGYNGGLSYSPDGRLIAFHRVADGRSELWLMAADGSDPSPLTATYIDEYSPEWSPDGAWLAFSAGVLDDSRGTFDLWLMRPDGSGRRVLNKAANTQAWHKWRPGPHYCR